MRLRKGDKVVFINATLHKKDPSHYPPVGTVGTIVEVDDDGTSLVDWGKVGVVLPPYSWWCENKLVELINEG